MQSRWLPSPARARLAACLLLLAAGCAGEGIDDGGGGNGPTGDFATIQSEIFNQSCILASCHDSATRQGGLDLTAGASYANLVDVPPQNPVALAAGDLRVTPGAPQQSFLYRKVTGELAPGEGARMPLAGTPLGTGEIELIESWIAAGALPD
ncbi:MAG: hypothetical protein AB1689_24220 [Thermodesulfobacteriota bacterium]